MKQSRPKRRYRLKIDVNLLTAKYLTGSFRSDLPICGVQFILQK
jgi:hypothetical protein